MGRIVRLAWMTVVLGPAIGTMGPARAAYTICLAGPDSVHSPTLNALATALADTGKFVQVYVYNTSIQTPGYDSFDDFNAVFAWTDNVAAPANQDIGDALGFYVETGGNVVLSTYGFGSPNGFGGQIMTTGYSPFTDGGTKGPVTGEVVAVLPDDPVFQGVDLAGVTFGHDAEYTVPGLDAGATLLATDGNGVGMIARNAQGNVIGLNAWPANLSANSPAFYDLLANLLVSAASADPRPAVPEPSGAVSLALGGLAILGQVLRRRAAAGRA